MLAISRALLLNPHLLVMGEAGTEGLAPLIVEQVEEILISLGEYQADIGVLVVEQNIGVATAVAKVAIMINGRINRVMEAARLEADRELQQRLLGVAEHGEEPPEEVEPASASEGERRPARARGPIRVYISTPPCRRAGRSRCRPAQGSRPRRARAPQPPSRRRRRPRRQSNYARSIAAVRRR